jgi:hypothetical protein
MAVAGDARATLIGLLTQPRQRYVTTAANLEKVLLSDE